MNIEFYFGHLNILKRSEQEVVHSIFSSYIGYAHSYFNTKFLKHSISM